MDPPENESRRSQNRTSGAESWPTRYNVDELLPLRGADLSDKPVGMPSFGAIFGYTAAHRRLKAGLNIKLAEELVDRELTTAEANRIAHHSLNVEAVKSYTTVAGTLVGGWRAYRTMGEYRLPFWRPNPEKFNPDVFLRVFKGPMARYLRHSWRFTVYIFLGRVLGGMLGQGIIQPIEGRRTTTDPELQQWREDIRNLRIARSAKVRAEYLARKKDNRHMPKKTKQDLEREANPDENQEEWGVFMTVGKPFYMEEAEAAPKRRPIVMPPKYGDSSESYDADSPTGGSFQDEVKRDSEKLSAWERIRRGEKPQPIKSQESQESQESQYSSQQGQRDGSSAEDRWTFAKTEEGRDEARKQAQKEFDDRIERERKLADDNNNKSGKGGGWFW